MSFCHPKALAAATLLLVGGLACRTQAPSSSSARDRQLVWSDEFDEGTAPDPARWGYDLGGGGWGNNELQTYTTAPTNVRIDDGHLIIEAHRAADGGYSSARLVTRDRQTWNWGRFEIRARLPRGRGTWPAIWMLGADIAEVGWPLCGEIDIMEQVGYDPDTLVATVHTQAFNHVAGTQRSARVYRPGMADDFHTYHLEWESDSIHIGMDGTEYFAYAKPDTATRASWPFDVPHYLLLNLAVGGNWGGARGVDTTVWPQRFEVDWVRVYQ